MNEVRKYSIQHRPKLKAPYVVCLNGQPLHPTRMRFATQADAQKFLESERVYCERNGWLFSLEY